MVTLCRGKSSQIITLITPPITYKEGGSVVVLYRSKDSPENGDLLYGDGPLVLGSHVGEDIRSEPGKTSMLRNPFLIHFVHFLKRGTRISTKLTRQG